MNSLNLLSSRVIGSTASPTRPRSRSQGEAISAKQSEELLRGRSHSDHSLVKAGREKQNAADVPKHTDIVVDKADGLETESIDEKTPLLETDPKTEVSLYRSRLRYLFKRIADALTAFWAAIGTPIIYVVSCFEDNGRYSPLMPLKRTRRKLAGQQASSSTTAAVGLSNAPEDGAWDEKSTKRAAQDVKLKHSYSSDSLRSTTSESESDKSKSKHASGQGRTLRQRSNELVEEPARRQSIRIKLNNEDALRKRKQNRSALAKPVDPSSTQLTVDNIKSPTSQTFKATRYPHAPHPPRPLIPRRQPSYSNIIPRPPSSRPPMPHQQQKTLVLDLDETLIHSLAKGGRMSSGHMVEVRLNAPVYSPVASISPQHGGGQPTIIGPQHPILYYVHKRPHCDEFLRKVCKWYKLVVFTASVQEYADPVIDWLEQERKFFVGRYYRQHCTFRNGAYIKDLSSIEPDLSKVVILDNSPMSYIFHEDNAIPIEGWINDPTDNDLLHLIPMLEGLQYVTDVRALLALRRGEAEA